jgi:hypothetical protein
MLALPKLFFFGWVAQRVVPAEIVPLGVPELVCSLAAVLCDVGVNGGAMVDAFDFNDRTIGNIRHLLTEPFGVDPNRPHQNMQMRVAALVRF